MTVVTGSTVFRSLPYRPEQPVIQRVAWRTDIHTAADGKERRHATRVKPRQTVDYTMMLDDEETRQIRVQLYLDGALSWMTPLWWESFVTTGEATSGGSTVTGTFTDHDLVDGQLVYIAPADGSRGSFEFLSGIVGSTLTISGTWDATYPAGARIHPAVTSYVARGQSYAQPAVEGYSTLQMSLTSNEYYPLGGAGATVSTYKSLTLHDREPIVPTAVSESADMGTELIDFGGVQSLASIAIRANLTRSHVYLIESRAELQWWKKFLDTVVGMREPFYAPTYRHDLILQAAPVASDTKIYVEDNPEFTQSWFNAGGSHLDLQLETSQGIFRSAITGTTDLGTYSQIDLGTALPAGPLVVTKVSFLELVRLGSDVVTFKHAVGHSMVEMALTVIEQ